MISSEKTRKILEKMAALGIREEDLRESFVRGSGAGGQKINKTSSTVCLTHLPSKMTVRCQESRFQSENRILARRLLLQKIENQILGEKSEERKKIEKIRRQKRRRSRRAKEKMLRDKKNRTEKLNRRKIVLD